ncbi:MAG: ribonuclease E/G [Paracoccaceae bacterium]
MGKKMLIDATHPEETRVVVADGNKIDEFDFESKNRRQIAGNIYLAKVSRIEPSLQAAFIEYGGNRHGFLAYSEIHPDYYQIPVADREALIAEELEFSKKSDEQYEAQQTIINSKTKSEETTSETFASTKVKEEHNELLSNSDSSELEDSSKVLESTNSQAIDSIGEQDEVLDLMPKRRVKSKRYKIQEVIKVRQILLIQVVKEERGNKGAALTTYLSLAGRYCVLMPNTAKGGGISRKITNINDRKKLKDISSDIDVPKGAGLIVRTAGAKRTKSEIKRDYEYLLRQWEQIRDLTLKSIAPAPIYEEGDLIKRSIRDLYNRDIDELLIEGLAGFNAAKDFMKMIMPTHAKNVKLYSDQMPLFARYQVESPLSGMFSPTVQLKSGGYIVIGITEALVAIDVNSGRATKEGSIEQTALNTNLEAAEEISRQMRLRDLAGLIVIDFIDMDERRNNTAVERLMKEKLSKDRARIQVGRISGFGLLEMSRQRLRPGMLEATTQACASCHGTGLIRSDDNLALTILRQLEEEGTRRTSKEVLLTAPVGIINYLMNEKREHISNIESRYGLAIRLQADTHLISPEFLIEKFKVATRSIPTVAKNVVSMGSIDLSDLDEELGVKESTSSEVEDLSETVKKRRRRKRRPSKHREALIQPDVKSRDVEEPDDQEDNSNLSSENQPNNKNAAVNRATNEGMDETVKKNQTKKSAIKKIIKSKLDGTEKISEEDSPKTTKRKKASQTTKQKKPGVIPSSSKKVKSKPLSKVKKDENKIKGKKIVGEKDDGLIAKTADISKPKKVRKRVSKIVEEKSLDNKKNESKEPKRTGWWSTNNK